MNKTKKLTDGAMMVALIGVLLFINRQSAGFIDFAIYWIVPIPIIIYTMKYDVQSACVVFISSVLLAFVVGMPTGLYYTAVGGVLGLLYGSALKRQAEQHVLLTISCVISIISSFLTMYVFASFFGFDMVEELSFLTETMNEVVNSVNESLAQSGSTQVLILNQSLIDFFPKLIILTNILTGILEGVLVHLLSYVILLRFKMKVNKMKPLNEVRLPKWAGFGLMALYIVATLEINGMITFISTDASYTIMMICFIVLLANGYLCAATIMAFYRKKKLMWILMLAIIPPFCYLVALLGFLDSVQNIRDKETVLKLRKS